ncbi:ATP-binding cassette domain-containing protein [Geovibrio thiophilus]|uniref:ATP-binding cassette domain-containing protein n=1 Tax=Geovibrio thiophilus TaxID=139438 RepID=A0A410JY01_9BACT|nr:ATP-binding cassette domain-containing protein [Geovibrio thiophilus]QAR32921.1 ATP-binding cassette domain-containing protein [Geovibrio thiophilus]
MLEIDVKKQLGQTFIDVNVQIPRTGITVFYGHSGAGKTSLINMIAGLLKPDQGRLSVNGKTFFDSDKKFSLPPEKRRCGYIFQDKRLFPYLSVKKNLLFGNGKRESSFGLDEAVRLLGIAHLMKRKPVFLSGGEAQRVAIGRALLSNPEIFLMDEPMSSLDSERKDELIPFIGKLPAASGIPVILVTHSYDEMIRLADYVVVLKGGKAVKCGTVNEVFHKPDKEICPYCSAQFTKKFVTPDRRLRVS